MTIQAFGSHQAFKTWLSTYDPADQQADVLMERFISGVTDYGIDIYRASMWLPTAHPELWGSQIIWTATNGCTLYRRDHSITSTSTFLNTPGEAVHKSRQALQWKLDVDESALPYPLLKEIKQEGGTDYLIVPFHTDHKTEQPWITFATQQHDGFSPAHIQALKDFCVPLSWKARVAMAEMASRSLLSVYLGKNAAQKVIAGEFKRGTGERIHSIIWFSDLRGFTELADAKSGEEVTPILDHYFECVSKPIEDHNGEILKFIGDAILAIFPLNHANLEQQCLDVLAAATTALSNLENSLFKGQDKPLKTGIALHLGEVFYGNIGGSSRLDFTVIGSAVNEAARIESLCKTTYPILASEHFNQHLPENTMVSIGTQRLRGVQKQHEIFTLPQFVSATPTQ